MSDRVSVVAETFRVRGTDKFQNGYAQVYGALDPGTIANILEIGVREGLSIMAWRDLFPKATVYGVDVSLARVLPELRSDPRVALIERNVLRLAPASLGVRFD